MDPEASTALVQQQQSVHPVSVEKTILEDVLLHTNRHPYLLQYLCQRLFIAEDEVKNKGYLRAPDDYDLSADHLLAGFFQIDFQYLSTIERRILLAVSRRTLASDQDIFAELTDETPERLRMFVYCLEKLDYLRNSYGQWTAGNEFLRRWLQENQDELSHKLESVLDDKNMEALLMVGTKMISLKFNNRDQSPLSKLVNASGRVCKRWSTSGI